MGPKASIWNALSPEGRLNNQWSSALAEPDPALRLQRLRDILLKLLEAPAKFCHLWPSFLDTFLDAKNASFLTLQDLLLIEKMASLVDSHTLPSLPMRPHDIWFRLLPIYVLHHDVQNACRVLIQIYWNTFSTPDEKARATRELASHRAIHAEYIALYIDFLQHIPTPMSEIQILELLRQACQTDFDTGPARLLQASEVTQFLLDSPFKTFVPGLYTTQGLRALQIEHQPGRAVHYFIAAIDAEPRDKTAILGLLTAWIQAGAYNSLVEFTRQPQNAAHTQDYLIASLIQFGMLLRWLDSPQLSEPIPISLASLEQLRTADLAKYVGDLLDATLGRAYLLTENIQRAAELLRPLLAKSQSLPQWNYYAAWAELLLGQQDALLASLYRVRTWQGQWTIACRILDYDRILAEQNNIPSLLKEVSFTDRHMTYLQSIDTRLALLQGAGLRAFPWQIGGGSVEEDLESLRTFIGAALYLENADQAQQLIAQPLFMRLPLADQLYWRGILALSSNKLEHGTTLLEKASSSFHYHRASIVLAVQKAGQNKLQDTKRLSSLLTTSSDSTHKLLDAYVLGREGQSGDAIQILKTLAALQLPQANFMLGNLYLQEAARAITDQSPTYKQELRVQAVEALAQALQKGARTLPAETQMLYYCAQFVAQPETRLQQLLRDTLVQLDNQKRQSWIKWNNALAQVWFGSSDDVLSIEAEITTISNSASRLDDDTIIVFAQALANVVLRTTPEHAYRLIPLLEHLSTRCELQQVHEICRQGITLALRTCYEQAGKEERYQVRQQLMHAAYKDPENISLSLLLSATHLEHGAIRAAVMALRSAQPQDAQLRNLCLCVADLLEEQIPSASQLPHATDQIPTQLKHIYELLAVATTLASGEVEQGYEHLSDLLQSGDQELLRLLDLGKVFPALCAYQAQRGEIPDWLREMLHSFAEQELDHKQAALLARCAASLGEPEVACRLWERSLNTPSEEDAPLIQEYVQFLCHLAANDYHTGNTSNAIRRLRQAAQWQQKEVSNNS